MKKLLGVLFLTLLLGLTGCDSGDEKSQAVTDYLQAKVDGDAEALRGLLCAALESTVEIEANSFAGVDATLQDVSCTSENIDDKTARVTCEGYILLDYGQEQNELPLGTYQVVNQNDEWKWCGEAE
jgi:hypothetical protein